MKELKDLKKVEKYIDQCMKCGFCSYFCPVYQVEKTETSLARGKNYLAKLLLQGKQGFTKEMAQILGHCLLCKRCVVNCPANAQIDKVVLAARAQLIEEKGLGLIKALMFRKIMADRKTFARMLKVAKVFQWLLPKREGKIRHLPDFLKALGAGRHIPELAKEFLRERLPEVNRPRDGSQPIMRVGFFMGCATDFIYPEIGLRIVEFLTRRGIEVIVPKNQNCCGAAIYFSGDLKTGQMLAEKNIEAFMELDAILTGCGTCSSSLKDYAIYLPQDDGQKVRYEAFAKKIFDFTEFVVDVLKVTPETLVLRREFEGKRATWHDPCHLIRYQGIKTQPRAILQSLKGLTYIEMPNADLCCGMGGSFSLYHYDTSQKIAEKKKEGIQSTGADVVVTACPGCMINLLDTLLRGQVPQRVHHLAELIE